MSPMFEIRPIPLGSEWFRRKAEDFLMSQGLRIDPMLDFLAGVYDSDENLVGCGGLDGAVIKCVALSESLRGQNVAASLVSRLYSIARDRGAETVSVFTKPENRAMFASLGFRIIGESPLAVMMQGGNDLLSSYLDSLRALPRGSRNGVIVMNANPMTLGHRWLIGQAASSVDRLTVIPVADNAANMFSYAARRSMLEKECAAFPNVTVAEGSVFSISSATFPSYFIKSLSDASKAHIALDLDVFCRHIAPALDAVVRFVGSEPADELTAFYNGEMKRILPQKGIEVVELPRFGHDGFPISASVVRRLIKEEKGGEALTLIPHASVPYVLAGMAAASMRAELDLTPKPGLVDRNDSGAHRDMDHALMCRSIEAIEPWFAEMAVCAAAAGDLASVAAGLRKLGIEAERSMMETTAGVNTHRGAIFALGLAVSAASRLIAAGMELSERNLSDTVAALAAHIPGAPDTHGAEVRRAHGEGGALAAARGGYAALFARWLPFRSQRHDNRCEADLRLLLLIISDLADSNVLYRCGEEEAVKARNEAAILFDNFSVKGLEEMNVSFITRNISHGGAADMLGLTIFTDSLLNISSTPLTETEIFNNSK